MSTIPFCPTSGRNRYRNRIFATPRYSCALHLSAFAGPSPGTWARRHGRRHSSPSTMLRRSSLCPSPTNVCTSSRRSCRTRLPLAKILPPVRTRRSGRPAAVLAWQGPHCNLGFHFRVPYAKPEGLLANFSFSLVCKSCQLVKLIEIRRKIQKLSN
jgi:hypothetical protein